MVLVLSRQNSDQLTPLFERKGDLYHQIREEITHYVSAEHAHIFAQPEYSNKIVRWNTEGQTSLAWKDLDEKQRQQLLIAIRSILSDIDAIIDAHPHSSLAQFFDKCRQFPSLDCVYAVDGRPVITAWGYAGENGSYDPLADIPKKPKKMRFMNWSYFPWLTALIALFFGLIASLIWANRDLAGKSCLAVYPPSSQVKEALKAQHKNNQLMIKRNQLLDMWNSLIKQCQIPPVKPLVPVEPPKIDPLEAPSQLPDLPPVQDSPTLPTMDSVQKKNIPKPLPPPPSPQPKADKKVDLPKESWNKKDTSMLNGCWHLTTHLELYQRKLFFTSHQPVTNWSLCFSPNSIGRQVLTRADGGTCNGPLRAGFQGDQLVLNQPEDCQGDFHLIPGKNVCNRLNDHEARCTYIDEEGHQSTGIFKR